LSITDVEWAVKRPKIWARSKRMMNSVLASCNPLNWNEWLADDVVPVAQAGRCRYKPDPRLSGLQWRVFGRPEKGRPRRMLKSISGGLSKDLSISTEIISGSHIILLGKLAARKLPKRR